MPYLNSVAFYRHLDRAMYDLIPLPPRAMAAAVERGALDAGPLPLAEVLRLGDALVPVGDLCVATRERANSVLLLSSVPVTGLAGRTIAVTSHTATSIQLLRVLFADRWRVTPGRYVELEDEHDAKLVIGDDALRRRGAASEPHGVYRHVYDLGEEWHRLTGLPFVFAAWAARRDVGEQAASALAASIARSVSLSLADMDALAREHATNYLTADEVAAYVSSFTYHLGPEERAAIEEFSKRLRLLPAWRPAEADRAGQAKAAGRT